jgi:hypothetical protein
VLLPLDLPRDQWIGLFTPARGEPIVAAEILSPPILEPLAEQTESNKLTATDGKAATLLAPVTNTRSLASSAPLVSDASKMPLPDEESLLKARELLKEVYRDQYAATRTPQERMQFVKKLIADAAKVEENAADYYELLRIAREMASSIGDLPLAVAANKLLEQRFQFDSLPLRHKMLSDVAKSSRPGDSAAILAEARQLIREAQAADRYDLALQAHDLALTLARIAGDKGEQNRLNVQRQALEQAKVMYEKQAAALASLRANPNDSAAHGQVGKYLCFVKNQWDAGLPHLARAADIQLRVIAAIDQSSERSPQETLSLGDQYWELASRAKSPSRLGLHMRAVHFYQMAVSQLTGSLEKIKAQKRIDEATAFYGRDEVELVIAPLRQKQGEP